MGSPLSYLLTACSGGNNHHAFFFDGVGGWEGGGCPPHTAEAGGDGRPPRPVPLGQSPPLGPPPPRMAHTDHLNVSQCGAQSRPIAVVALGHSLPLTPSCPLKWQCVGNPATKPPQLAPLNGLGDMQVREPKIRALG